MSNLISFRLDQAKKEMLDAIASLHDRDRSYVLNEAIDAYLAINDWQIAHIKKGIRQADKGEFAGDADVRKAFAQWRK